MSSLSQEEIDALINQLSGQDAGVPAKEAIDGRRVKSFDFRFNKRLDKFSNNQLQTLRTLHENFTRLLNNSLSVYLRTRVEATIVSIEQISYGDFIASIGIRQLVMAAKAVARGAGRLVLLAPSPAVTEALETSGLLDLLPIVRSEDEASSALAR